LSLSKSSEFESYLHQKPIGVMNAKSLNAIVTIKINKNEKIQDSEAFASMLFIDLHFKLIYEKSICFES
jgi:hypothetical protein